MKETGDIGFILPARTSLPAQFATLRLVNSLLRLRFRIVWASKYFVARSDVFSNGHTYEPGDYLVGLDSKSSDARKRDSLFVRRTAAQRGVLIHQVLEEIDPVGYGLYAPKIAVYKGTGTWDAYLWYTECLRTMGFAHDCLSPSEISSGKLAEYDLYVQPGGDETWQAAALWPRGREEIRKFLESGGRYLGSCGGLDIAGDGNGTKLLSPDTSEVRFLNLVTYNCPRNIRRDAYPHDEWARKYFYHIDFKEYSQVLPVAVGTPVPIRTRDKTSPVVFGYPETMIPGIRYSAGPTPRDLHEPMRTIADFAPDLMPLDSPWEMPPEEAIRLFEGASAISESTFGKGKLVFFAPHPEDPFNPEFFRMVANAIFYLTAMGPEEAHRLEKISIHPTEASRGNALSERDFQEVRRELFETKNVSESFATAWDPVQSLGGWTYKHIPEWLLRLPGYSQVVVPELQLKTLRQRLDDLLDVTSQLEFRLRQLLSPSKDLGDTTRTEQALAVASEVIRNMPGRLRSIQEDIKNARMRLEGLKPAVRAIIELRRTVDGLKQTVDSREELKEAWTKLDARQSEFNDSIWKDIVFYLDGKAELSIFSVWKPGIIGRESKGALTELADILASSSFAFDLSERALNQSTSLS